ncbi:30S ribosomal protein S18 [Candidatus Uhrbacteria bacterium RIFCSPLOWO2_01_FULL_47_24]|uniref:Small ribosomal subunit protein bS18 n=1 Tax=Candidatus Uhrbacteria bacterium RIFCSPLOWO2_01_FULL_47_24 TaxID=1802401 RepID=A0A1F7UTC3_9BACT|nr:MAG: 30S ribosomal protein S18 [Candidatus Uhrbacteria bacterium RIFCSPHIGHO2_01_FULL_47_11]OGL69135.1 MAG: 30S ribosomal protein S18 [Candidatus Uhrbacteria bacterium RIFCSPHIGHO2_02_FULL_46_47]OGL74794.1 MAG: 30S ribosomal protein S18 [Candidatus Uhrbacteria bacterium RIFCSPHIGHO2_12_FULL_47_11]OGL81506.1 MAG: 30S ribosomal protein S18 [Candidatus Uhrbacteria bacterium RIFCSPLOWO2_01_FULL_47_24]OGL83751.1 MAG: 30S ribosomal protein S18 [Candidatus Uhrbacteria bacterium RIFCSPLOWO2_02_FULL_
MASIQEKPCYFCVNNSTGPDFKDVNLLKRFVSAGMKIMPQRRSGLCAKHQRKVARAIKHARTLALMPYMPE